MKQNPLMVSLKTKDLNDPSATNPVFIPVRNPKRGRVKFVTLTEPTSFVISAGSPRKEKTMTQCQTLIKAFKKGKSLTVLTAIKDYGIYALSQRIGELKRRHKLDIQSKIIKTSTGKHVSMYWLK